MEPIIQWTRGENKLSLKRVTQEVEDMEVFAELEKTVAGTALYSAATEQADILAELQNGEAYFIIWNGHIVGNISYERRGANHVYVSGLVVIPLFKRRGIARFALERLLQEFGEIKTIDLVTHPKNEGAIALYESLGFKIQGPILENNFGDGQPRVRLCLER